MENPITASEVQDQVSHWLRSPVYSYLGSDYGNDLPGLNMQAFSGQRADDQIAKLRADVPVLQALPAGFVNLFSRNTLPDRTDIVISVGSSLRALG